MVLKVFGKEFHFLLTGDGAQVVGGTSPGCAEVWNFRTFHPGGLRTQTFQDHARGLDEMVKFLLSKMSARQVVLRIGGSSQELHWLKGRKVPM